MSRVRRGYLVLADISGYTRFLAGVELEHSQDILADLLGCIVAETRGCLVLAKLEGDAVFWHAQEAVEGHVMLSVIEGAYAAFRRRQRDISHLTTCTCEACRRIPELGLKFVAHAGEFAEHEVAGSAELVGPDVILVHRLLKNTIGETTGSPAYAAFTAAAVAALGLGGDGFQPVTESYADVGTVEVSVLDLAERWEVQQAATSIRVEAAEADVVLSETYAATPAVIWGWMASPSKRQAWNGADQLDQIDPGGVPGVGSINHCVHGRMKLVEEIIDWKPFAYLTIRTRFPIGPFRLTFTLEPEGDDRCRLTFLAQAEGGRMKRIMMRPVIGKMRKETARSMARLRSLVDTERAPEPAAVHQ